jgi:hypothetical protein
MIRQSRSLIAACCAMASLASIAHGEEVCMAPPEVVDATRFDRSRTWLHEPGWFTPLDKPKTVLASGEDYPAEAPMLTVSVSGETRAYPVHAMAYHHVANDIVGGQPVVTTY